MESYIGVIYYSDGTREETGRFNGVSSDKSCERHTADLFARRQKERIAYHSKPTRFEVKKVN